MAHAARLVSHTRTDTPCARATQHPIATAVNDKAPKDNQEKRLAKRIYGINLPGFRMPLGSSVILIARNTSMPSAPFSFSIQGR